MAQVTNDVRPCRGQLHVPIPFQLCNRRINRLPEWRLLKLDVGMTHDKMGDADQRLSDGKPASGSLR